MNFLITSKIDSPEPLKYTMDLTDKILSDPINKRIIKTFRSSNIEYYFVGGYIRDLMRGIKSNDKDLILKNNVKEMAHHLADKFNGTLIVLGRNQVYRVVLKKPYPQILDLSAMKHTILDDLKARDFSVNAIAWSPEKGIIDPFNGVKDLRRKIIRVLNARNILNDPLRILRAYRIAADIGLRIDSKTGTYLHKYSKYIRQPASERITEELFKILGNVNSSKYLQEAYKNTILNNLFNINNITANKILRRNIKLLRKFDLFAIKLLNENRNSIYLHENISQNLSRLGLLRLSILMRDLSSTMHLLKVSNNINNAIKDINNGIESLNRIKSDTDMYKIFDASGERIIEMVFIISFIRRKKIKEIFERAFTYSKLKNKILLNGNEIQNILNIKEGRKVGEILSALEVEKFRGVIRTRHQAKKWLISNLT